MARKTVELAALKAQINSMILHTPDADTGGREALGSLLSTVLMDAKQYNGFKYLTSHDMAQSQNGKSVGIHMEHIDNGTMEQKFNGTDKTRVHYY